MGSATTTSRPRLGMRAPSSPAEVVRATGPRRAPGLAVCQHWSVRSRHIAGLIGAAAAAAAMQSAPIPLAQAVACPDAEVVFARGTTEDPGVGPTGQAFVDSLRTHVGAKSVGVY